MADAVVTRAQPVMIFRVSRAQSNRYLQFRDTSIRISSDPVGNAQMVMGWGKTGIDLDGPDKMRHRFRRAIHCRQQKSNLVFDLGRLRVEQQGLLESMQRGRSVSLRFESPALAHPFRRRLETGQERAKEKAANNRTGQHCSDYNRMVFGALISFLVCLQAGPGAVPADLNPATNSHQNALSLYLHRQYAK